MFNRVCASLVLGAATLILPAAATAQPQTGSAQVNADSKMTLTGSFRSAAFKFEVTYFEASQSGVVTQKIEVVASGSLTNTKFEVVADGVAFGVIYFDANGQGVFSRTEVSKGSKTSIPHLKAGSVVSVGPGKTQLASTSR